jgi:phage gpG-like protein
MNLTVDVRAEQLLAQLAGSGDRFMADQAVAVDRLSIEVQALVKDTKLSGQVLHTRTGTLRRSINRKIIKTPSTVAAEVGTNVVYAAVHEYGFDGPVNVREHTRKLAGGGTANVRAYVMSMHMPERSFLRSTLDEQTTHIIETLRAAALKSLRASVAGGAS